MQRYTCRDRYNECRDAIQSYTSFLPERVTAFLLSWINEKLSICLKLLKILQNIFGLIKYAFYKNFLYKIAGKRAIIEL